MISCKKTIITACFILLLPLISWSEAPVFDDSDNFAIYDEPQEVQASSARRTQYDEPQMEIAQRDRFQDEAYPEEGPALVREEPSNGSNNDINDNAKLIDKIQNLQQEIQELRGQLEVQAHDLKLLQQQQIAFYKDLDTRLNGGSGQSAQAKLTTDLSLEAKKTPSQPSTPSVPTKVTETAVTPLPVLPVSKINPADEQIGYLAAYELVKNKRYDDAIKAMQIFAQKYPKGGYTANAEYWLGELFLLKKEYAKAIIHFEVVLKKFPSSSKSAASLLKSGYAFAATGDTSEAQRRLQQVIKTYPDTSTARLATLKLKTINML